jgi:hypothetical protein
MEIPCKDCLCFPVCKSQAVMKNPIEEGDCVKLHVLNNKCILFTKWFLLSNYYKSEIEVLKCFNATSSTWLVKWYTDEKNSM